MATYLFNKIAAMTEDEFGMKFQSMRDLYSKEQGDPVTWLRDCLLYTSDAADE